MSTNEGQSVMKMTILSLETLRSEESFWLFWTRTEQKRQQLRVEAPQLPRPRKVLRRLKVGLQFLRQESQWKSCIGEHTL